MLSVGSSEDRPRVGVQTGAVRALESTAIGRGRSVVGDRPSEIGDWRSAFGDMRSAVVLLPVASDRGSWFVHRGSRLLVGFRSLDPRWRSAYVCGVAEMLPYSHLSIATPSSYNGCGIMVMGPHRGRC